MQLVSNRTGIYARESGSRICDHNSFIYSSPIITKPFLIATSNSFCIAKHFQNIWYKYFFKNMYFLICKRVGHDSGTKPQKKLISNLYFLEQFQIHRKSEHIGQKVSIYPQTTSHTSDTLAKIGETTLTHQQPKSIIYWF